MPRADGPFEILERVNDNAYKVDLPGDYGVSATFNVADLSPYLEDDHLANLRANSSQEGEDEGGPSMGPIQEPQDMLGGLNFSPKVKKQVQALLIQLPILPGYSSIHAQARFCLLVGGRAREGNFLHAPPP